MIEKIGQFIIEFRKYFDSKEIEIQEMNTGKSFVQGSLQITILVKITSISLCGPVVIPVNTNISLMDIAAAFESESGNVIVRNGGLLNKLLRNIKIQLLTLLSLQFRRIGDALAQEGIDELDRG